MSNSRENYLRLDSNENLWGPSPRALEALRNLSGATISSYPHTDEFIESLSELLDLPKESLLLTNGSDEGLEFIISESVKPDEEVIIPEPSFSMFDILCDRVGARILKVPYGENYAFPEQELGDAISDRTKLVIIANPNNPTGTLATRKQLETLIVRFPKTTFLLDEAYGEFSGINNMELVKRYSNVIITRTFSKAYGLAGLRLGYVVSQPENISRLTGVMPYNVNQAAIAAGVASLKDTLYLERYVLAVRDARNKLQAALRQMGYTVFLSEANFLLVDFGPEASAIARKLKERGVLVRDFSQGRSTQNCLRVTVGTENEVDAFLTSLEAILSSPDAFLFDMDGVLIDESQSYRLCIKKTVESFLKKEVSLQEIDALKKRGGVNNDYDCVEALLKQYELTVDRSQMIRTFQSYYFGECVQNERWIFPLSLLKRLKRLGRLGIVTGRPREEALMALERFAMTDLFDVVISADDVSRGKPNPEGIKKALKVLGISRGVYVGDLPDDALAAKRAKIPYIHCNGTNYEKLATKLLSSSENNTRRSRVSRYTTETEIDIKLSVEGRGEARIVTGIGFFDHMLQAFTKHGLFDISIDCKGDLHVDQHHTVEDVGLVLGQAFRKALGDMRGINRTGYFIFPMDESRALCAIDICDRPCLKWEVPSIENIGTFETINLPNFFSGFVTGARVNLHANVSCGDDPHHKVEALFKAFGKAMQMACSRNSQMGGQIPSTKGRIG